MLLLLLMMMMMVVEMWLVYVLMLLLLLLLLMMMLHCCGRYGRRRGRRGGRGRGGRRRRRGGWWWWKRDIVGIVAGYVWKLLIRILKQVAMRRHVMYHQRRRKRDSFCNGWGGKDKAGSCVYEIRFDCESSVASAWLKRLFLHSIYLGYYYVCIGWAVASSFFRFRFFQKQCKGNNNDNNNTSISSSLVSFLLIESRKISYWKHKSKPWKSTTTREKKREKREKREHIETN